MLYADSACAAKEFRCDERQCIPEAYVCDVIPDCDNAQDELNCDDLTTTVRTTESTGKLIAFTKAPGTKHRILSNLQKILLSHRV